MTSVETSSPSGEVDGTTEDLAAQVALLTRQVAELQQVLADRAVSGGGQGQPPLYATVEEWVRDYLLPGFPRPVGEVGLVRWHWCEQWWRHDEAVTRLTALWYGWEHARLEMTGMLGWLRELDHHLPMLLGPDGPFRSCAPGIDGSAARHKAPTVAAFEQAPKQWWDWWDTK
ncbi:protein of unknown function [Micromonospora echinofusca]|uniref:DUF4913 domain-containing protein n=1 Tax=Micromonospora echinofusca TaxID=47858 RepID=A0A1C5G6M0_MICEH|nr:protein of unknown function [Micromonospora echinofusca]